MQVVLLEKIENLGNLGDEVSVKSGFGRNFLIPNGKALSANESNKALFESRRIDLEAASAEVLADAERRQEKLIEVGTVSIFANAGLKGKLFGSISASDIANRLNAAGGDVKKKEVRLPLTGALRHTGEYDIDIQLHASIIVTIKIKIIAEVRLKETSGQVIN